MDNTTMVNVFFLALLLGILIGSFIGWICRSSGLQESEEERNRALDAAWNRGWHAHTLDDEETFQHGKTIGYAEGLNKGLGYYTLATGRKIG